MSAHAFWHPFADMSAVDGHELIVESGDGAYVTAADGRRYLDASAGLWYCNVGHGRRELAEAAMKQMSAIAAFSNFGDLATRTTLELADRLAALSGMDSARVFFTSGGSDAVDTAVKFVRRYWALLGQPSRQTIVTRTRSYHGMHMAGTSLSGIAANRDGYGDLDPQVRNCAWDDPDDLERVIVESGPASIAAFFCEPIIGAGGVYAPPDGYIKRVRDICREHGVLFVADEVITGFGRAGAMFASLRWDIRPDLILAAKGLTSGYLPMGAVLFAGPVAELFWTTPGLMWRHGYTYSGHATAAAVAMANLDIIEGEDLVGRVAENQLALGAALAPLAHHQFVVAVRAGVGLLGAVQLDPDVLAEQPDLGVRLLRAMRERGVITRMLADGSVQVSPSFVVTRGDMALIASAIDEGLTSLGSTRAATVTLDVDLLPDQSRDEMGGFGSMDERLLAEVPPHHVG